MLLKSSTLTRGHAAEDSAVRHLRRNGLKLVERNYRSPYGEIDLIMRDGHTLVFVEVRYRRSRKFGAPEETVDDRKQRRLRATAEHYLQRGLARSRKPCRFDIVAFTGGDDGAAVTWLQNAF